MPLNIANLDDLTAAFELMEGKAPMLRMRNALDHVTAHVIKVRANAHHDDFANNDIVPGTSIYGNAGFHRYYVRFNGDVVFSAFHAQEKRTAQAEMLGFEIFH